MEIDCVQRNDKFKFKLTLDRQNVRLKLIYCLLPDPPRFSLPSTFKGKESREIFLLQATSSLKPNPCRWHWYEIKSCAKRPRSFYSSFNVIPDLRKRTRFSHRVPIPPSPHTRGKAGRNHWTRKLFPPPSHWDRREIYIAKLFQI